MANLKKALIATGAGAAVGGALIGGAALLPTLTLRLPWLAGGGAAGGAAVEIARSRSAVFLDLWGKSIDGARATLSAIESGTFRLIPDLRLGHLQYYRQVAQNAIDRGGGDSYSGYMVQSLRLQIIEKIELLLR